MSVIEQRAALELGRLSDLAVIPRRKRPVSHSTIFIMAASDLLGIGLAFLLGSAIRVLQFGSSEGTGQVPLSILREGPYALVFLAVMGMYGLYGRPSRRVRTSWFTDFRQLAHGLAVGSVAVVALSSGLHRLAGSPKIGWVEACAMATPALVFIPLMRGAGAAVARRHPARRTRVAVVGCGLAAERLVRRFEQIPDLDLVGLVTDFPTDLCEPARVLGGPADLIRICRQNGIDRIFVSSSGLDAPQLDQIIRTLPSDIHVSIVPIFSDLLTWQTQVEDLDGLTIMDVPPAQLSLGRRAAKRAIDVAVSGVALVLLAPVLAAVAVAVKLFSRGPVLFRQERIGHLGQPFSIVKFRTMVQSAEADKLDLRSSGDGDGPLFKMRSDPRVTGIGAILRQTSLDELPQLFNVFLGQMSLVGPRPLVPEESAALKDGWAARRFDVKPGMTGLWQVSGRSDLPYEDLRQLDYAYAASWSLWWDLKILSQTPASILRRRGAY